MTLITEMMQRPLDPGYAAAAESRQRSGLSPATGHRSALLVLFAILIGALLTTSAMALRVPATGANTIKSDLVRRIEASRAHADARTRLIADLRREINTAQAAALSQQSQTALAAELSGLELAAGAVPVAGPGLVLTVDDAAKKAASNTELDPRASTELDLGKVLAADLQVIVNGLWKAGAEAISINGHRLTSRAAIRSAGEAILVDYRPLVRPYVITAIGDPGSLNVEFAGNDGGSYLQMLKDNNNILGDIQTRDAVVVPGEPTLSLQRAKPVQSAVTKKTTEPTTPARETAATLSRTNPPRATAAPQTTETAP